MDLPLACLPSLWLCSIVSVLHRNALDSALGLGWPVVPETTTSSVVSRQPVTSDELLVVTHGTATLASGTISATLLIMANIRKVTANISLEVSSPLNLLPTPTVATNLDVTTSRHSIRMVTRLAKFSLLLIDEQTKLEPVNAASFGRLRFRLALATLLEVTLKTFAISRYELFTWPHRLLSNGRSYELMCRLMRSNMSVVVIVFMVNVTKLTMT